MFRPRLTYANVASTLALVLAMGGTAVAVTAIDGSSITNRSIAGKKLIKNTVTGTEVKESTLGKVPNADKLDGIDSTAFAKGSNVRVLTHSARIASNADSSVYSPVYTIPGFGTLEVRCGSSGDVFGFSYQNGTSARQQYAYSLSNFGTGSLPSPLSTYGDFLDVDSGIVNFITNSGGSRGFRLELTILRSSASHYVELTITGVTRTDDTENCDYAATAILH